VDVVNERRREQPDWVDMAFPSPLPGSDDTPFGVLVDRYVASHGVSRAETFRRIAAVTGNSPAGLSIRYHERYDRPWRFALPSEWT
jgi:hypothetical protein